MAKELKDLTKRSENYSQWYNDLVVKADLAEQSAVRGCMVIKPYGYYTLSLHDALPISEERRVGKECSRRAHV